MVIKLFLTGSFGKNTFLGFLVLYLCTDSLVRKKRGRKLLGQFLTKLWTFKKSVTNNQFKVPPKLTNYEIFSPCCSLPKTLKIGFSEKAPVKIFNFHLSWVTKTLQNMVLPSVSPRNFFDLFSFFVGTVYRYFLPKEAFGKMNNGSILVLLVILSLSLLAEGLLTNVTSEKGGREKRLREYFKKMKISF